MPGPHKHYLRANFTLESALDKMTCDHCVKPINIKDAIAIGVVESCDVPDRPFTVTLCRECIESVSLYLGFRKSEKNK